jgi:ATP-dependent Zn protease
LHAAEDRAKRTLQQSAGKLSTLAEALVERESLDEEEIRDLIGPSVQQAAERSAPTGSVQVASVRE